MLAQAGCGKETEDAAGEETASGSDGGGGSADAAVADGAAGESDGGRQQRLDELEAFYQLMRTNALGFGFADGDWTEDLGDAPFYGAGFYARIAEEENDEEARTIAEAARDYNISVLQNAGGDINYFMANLEEVIMAALGLIEYADATGDTSFIAGVDLIIDTTNSALSVYGDYLQDTGINSWALQVYGPTAITAAVALLNLQYATYLDTGLEQARLDRATEIVAAIDANALQADGSGGERYLFQSGVTDPYLYPNAMMILVLNRQHENTGLPEPLARAENVFRAIQPLKDDDRGGYNSPYSAAVMGATTDDFATLSSQNYLLLALSILYRNTGDERYLDEALDVFDFIRTRLYDETQGIILHHWMDGRPALPEDPEYFCSGCNLQFLYVAWFFLESVSL
jgi:hypothetical protein